MKLNKIIGSVLLGAVVTFSACGKKGTSIADAEETSEGQKYIRHTQKDKNASVDTSMVVEIDFSLSSLSKDSSVFSYVERTGNPMMLKLAGETPLSKWNEVFLKSSVGDSITFFTEASAFVPAQAMGQIGLTPADSILKYNVKILDFVTMEEVMDRMKKKQEEQQAEINKSIDAGKAELQKYLDDKGIKNYETDEASGLKYVITKKGKGKVPVPGEDIVVANYKGSLLNGDVFDSSYDRGTPFEFPVGARRVIAGWDIAFSKLKVGSKATLYIPPHLGYGPRGGGAKIPPNAPLIFEVELVDTKPLPKQ